MLGFEKWIACMTEITASTLLAEMKPAWRAALGDRVSHEYIAGFIRRNRQRLEAALDPIVAVLNAVPDVHVAELAEDVAKRLRGRSEIVNVLANAPHNFGVELDRQLPQVMLEYLPEGTGTPQRWAIYRRWSDDTEFRRQLRAQVYELLWERRPGWAAGASERAEERKTKETETRNSVRSVRLRSAATNLAHQRVQVAADSVAKLRHQDVERVLRETPAEERRQVAYILGDLRADLSSEIDEVMREVLGEPANWSEYGRQEIYEPGSRAKREATLAEDAAERALEAAAPMIAEAEREIAAAKGEPLPVIIASLEAGGIVLLSPLGFLGRDLFQTYRDATSRLQYVSYPKKGQRGIPKVVARAVLALERDGFEVRAEDPEVVKSLIVTGGLDHALPVGPPPPRALRDEPARPPTRTSDPSLIARVNAMAEDPPTSTLKYLVKTLRERGDLPLQVKDWKEGGWRPVETAIEEAEGKAARRLARKPKAERLRADGVERPAKDANEEHAAQALVQLANMDPDKARQVNDAGFSKSDVNTGHALARRWEASGELTGDEWEWAVAVANKYRRQVGPLPEPKSKAKRQREERGLSAEERLFVGVMPTGIVYADRSREVDGDYARCAFLPFDTLALEIAPKCPKDMLEAIKADAATIIARRGEKFSISASNQTVVLGSKHADVPVTSTARLTNTPRGRVNLSPAASRMLAKMTNGAWSLALSHKDTDSLAAAIELRDAGLAEITGEPRVVLPMLTVDNHERASTILNVHHPEWGTKRFNRDPSERGHHSYGTGSNSAVLFASDFSNWVVASWLPTKAEVAAEHAEHAAYLDENRPGWREDAVKAMETMLRTKVAVMDAVNGRIHVKHGGFLETKTIQNAVDAWAEPTAKETGSKKRGSNPLSYAGHSLATVQDITAFLKRSLGKLYEKYMLNINVVRNVGDHSVMLTFYRVPPDAGELEAANAKCKVRIHIHGRTNGSTWPDDATPTELTAYTVWAHNAPKFRKRTGPPSVIVAAVSSWFVLNIADLTGTAAPAQTGRLREVRIDDMDAQVAREEAAMGNALRAERDREEAKWSGAVRRGVKAEIANGHDAETAKRIAVANLGKDFEYYDKRSEEKWGERP